MFKDMETTIAEDFVFYLRAGYPYFHIEAEEQKRCIDLLSKSAENYEAKDGNTPYKDNIIVWDIQGDQENSIPPDPEAILEMLDKAEENAVVFLKNFDWFLYDDFNKPNKQIVTTLQNKYNLYCKKGYRKSLVIVSNISLDEGVPKVIAGDFLPLNFDLPGEVEITEVMEKIITSASKNKKFTVPDEKQKARIVDAALGLKLSEVENAFAYCLVKRAALIPTEIDRIKARMVEKVSGVYYIEYDSTLHNLKVWKTLRSLLWVLFIIKMHMVYVL